MTNRKQASKSEQAGKCAVLHLIQQNHSVQNQSTASTGLCIVMLKMFTVHMLKKKNITVVKI